MARETNDGAKALSRSLVTSRFAHFDRELAKRDTLLEGFSVADAYLLSVLNWCEHAGLDNSPYPNVLGWRARMRARPSVARAMAMERPLLGAG